MSKLFAHAKRMLTGVLVVATILTTAPTYAFATENTDVPEEPVIEAEAPAEVVTEPVVDESEVVDDVSTGDTDIVEVPDEELVEEPVEEVVEEADTQDALLGDAPEEDVEEEVDTADSLLSTKGSGNASNYKIDFFDDDDDEDAFKIDPSGGMVVDGGNYYVEKDKDDQDALSSFNFFVNISEHFTLGENEITAKAGSADLLVDCKLTAGRYSVTVSTEDGNPIDDDVEVVIDTVEDENFVVTLPDTDSRFTAAFVGKEEDVTTYNVYKGDNISFTITPDDNYGIFEVYAVTIIDEDPVVTKLTAASGKYTLKNVQAATEITVVASVVVDTKVEAGDGEEDYFAVTLTGTRKLTEYGEVTNNAAITGKISKGTGAPNNLDMSGYTYFAYWGYGDDESGDVAVSSSYGFTIPATVVKAAQTAGEELYIDVLAIKTVPSLIAAEDNKADLYLATKEVSGWDIADEAIDIDPEKATEVDYKKDAYVAAFTDSKHEVKSVKIGTTTLATQKVKIDDESVTLYKIPAAKLTTLVPVELTVVTDLKATTDAIEFDVTTDEYSTFKVTTSGAKVVVDPDTDVAKWTLPKGIKTFTYTVETTGSFIPTVELNGVEVKSASVALNKAKNGLVYTYTEAAADYDDAKVEVKAEETKRTLTVGVENDYEDIDDLVDFVVKVNGRQLDGKDGEYEVEDPFATVVVTATIDNSIADLDLVKLSGKATVDGKEVSAANGTVSVSTAICDEDGKTEVVFGTEDILSLFVSPDENFEEDVRPVKNNANLGTVEKDDEIYVGYYKGLGGEDPATSITKVVASPASSVLSGWYDIDDETGIVTIDPSQTKGTAAIKVAVTCTDPDTKKAVTTNFSFTVKQDITTVTVKGADKDRTIKQTAGTFASYPVTLNANADYENLDVKPDSTINGDVYFDSDTKTLRIQAYEFDEDDGDYISTLQVDAFTVSFYEKVEDGDDIKIDGADIHVVPTKPVIGAPTVTVANASDIDVTLKLTPPKNAQDIRNLVYVITATATTAVDDEDPMASYYQTKVPWNDGTVVLPLTKDKEAKKGEGHAQNYKISVKLVQYDEIAYEDGELTVDEDAKVIATGTEKTLTQKTKDVTYEVNLGVTKKTTTFTKGETDVLAGVAKFSAATSYTDKPKVYIVDADNHSVASTDDDGVTVADDLSIYINDTSNFPVGKLTMYVVPDIPERTYGTPATVALTVKEPIKEIEITANPATTHLLKADGKAATMKFSATGQYWYEGPVGQKIYVKAASNKVIWEVAPKQEDSRLDDYLEINPKTGALTVKAGYVLYPDTEDYKDYNSFIVTAYADDYPENTAKETYEVELTSEGAKIDGALIAANDEAEEDDNIDDETGYFIDWGKIDPNSLLDGYIEVLGTNILSSKDLDVKISPATGIGTQFEDPENVGDPVKILFTSVTKAGKYTVTIATTDGSKSSYKLSFTVVEPEADYRFNVYDCANDYDRVDIAYNEGYVVDSNELEFAFTRIDSPLVNAGKLTVKGGSIIASGTYNKGGYTNIYYVKPTSGTVVATYTTGKKKEVITIYNTMGSGKLTRTDKSTIMANNEAGIETALTFKATGAADLDSTSALVFRPSDAIHKVKTDAEYYSYLDLRDQLEEMATEVDPATGVFTLTGVLGKEVSAGSYKFDVTAISGSEDPMTLPVTVTLTVKAAAKPSATLAAKATIKYNDTDGKVLAFNKGASFTAIDEVVLFNNNNKGIVNNFAAAFAADVDDDDNIVLKRTNTHLENNGSNIIPDSKGNIEMIGWIQYTIIGEDGYTKVTKTDKVTVTVTNSEENNRN